MHIPPLEEINGDYFLYFVVVFLLLLLLLLLFNVIATVKSRQVNKRYKSKQMSKTVRVPRNEENF